MTWLGARPKGPYPCTYRGFRLVRAFGRVYAIPPFLDPEEIHDRDRLTSHPAILSAPTRDELDALIEAYDPSPYQPEPLGRYEGYRLVRYRGAVYGVPEAAGPVDLGVEDERREAKQTFYEVANAVRQHKGLPPRSFGQSVPF